MFETIAEYFSYPFVVYALVVGDGLSHIAFGAIAIASVLKIANQDILVFPVTALCAILLLRLGQNSKVNGDAAIAMLSVGSLAIGYLLMNVFSVSSNLAGDVCTTLFGATSILTLSQDDVIISVVLCAVVIGIFLVFYNKIFAITFDENFARAVKIKVELYNLIIAVTISAVIVVAMNLVGSLLISALVVFPSMSSMRLFHTFKRVIISSVVISVLCAFSGIMISILSGTPVGSTIVTANITVFAIAYIVSLKKGTMK